MVERQSEDASRQHGMAIGGSGRKAGLWLPARPSQAEAPTPRTLISEGMICVADALCSFEDPGWGTITFQLSVWRRFGDTLPEYEVVVE